MKKLLLSIALLFSIIPAYSMEENDGMDDLARQFQEKNKIDETKEAKEQVIAKFPQVHFSPGIAQVLSKFIHDEQESMRGAWYRFTLYNLAKEMIERIKKGVKVSLIIDQSNFGGTSKNDEGDFCEGLKVITECGGKIYKKVTERNEVNQGNFEIMHHKFMIFNKNVSDKKLLWTGSFNATGQANLKNCENVIVVDDAEAIKRFETEYETVEALSDLLSPDECTSTKTKKRDRKTDIARKMNGIPLQEEV